MPELLADMEAPHRSKLFIVHSGIPTGKRIIVWGWSVVLTAIKNVY